MVSGYSVIIPLFNHPHMEVLPVSSNPFALTFQAPGQDAPTAVTPAPGSGPFPAWPAAATALERATQEPAVQAPAPSAQDTPTAVHPVLTQADLDGDRERAAAITAAQDQARQGEGAGMSTEPEPEKDTPTPPALQPRARTGQRRRLSQAEAREVRVQFQYRRELANDPDSPEDWETVSDTENALAQEYGISRSSITNVVTGQTYPDAGGPIDRHRAARRELYEREAAQFGPEVARSRLMSYRDTGQALPASITLTVQEPGKKPRTFTYAAGTTVTVATTAQDGGDV